MGLTNITNRLTPSVPMEFTFGNQPIAPGTKITTLIGHRASSGGSGTTYAPHTMVALGDPDAAKLEVDTLFGTGSEIGKMAYAFVASNALVSTGARPNFPAFRIVALANADADFGSAAVALTNIQLLRSDFLVNPYDCTDTSDTPVIDANMTTLIAKAVFLSGVDRDLRGQFGTLAIGATVKALTDAVSVHPDTAYASIAVFPDTDGTPSQVVGVVAAAYAGMLAGNAFPYLGLDNVELGALLPPTLKSDYIIQDPSGTSESALTNALAPLTVDINGKVRCIRARNCRKSVLGDGVTTATAYLDVQDIQPLFDFREDIYTIMQTPPFKNQKATDQQAAKVRDVVLALAFKYQDEGAFQHVKELSPKTVAAINGSTRGRIDFQALEDVAPINHVTAGNIQATVFQG